MLKVHRDSWHYRIWTIGRPYSHRPRNLCRYFWYIAMLVVIGLVVASLALGALVGLAYLAYDQTREFLIATGVIVAIALGIVGLGILVGWLHERYEKKQEAESEREYRVLLGEEEPAPPKEPGVIRSFLKAKKEKYCPLIEVVDDTYVDTGPSAEVQEFWKNQEGM